MLSKPLKVIIYIYIVSKSAFERFAHKDAACKTEAFLHTLFLENEAQTDQKNYVTMLFKQVGLPKISSILQKMKISPKPKIRPFCIKAFNCNLICTNQVSLILAILVDVDGILNLSSLHFF